MTSKVLVAFLLPIVLFAVGLGLFGWFLCGTVAAPYQTPLALFLALATTVALMGVVRTALSHYQGK